MTDEPSFTANDAVREQLDAGDTAASVQEAYREACDESRVATASFSLDVVVRGREPRPLWREAGRSRLE